MLFGGILVGMRGVMFFVFFSAIWMSCYSNTAETSDSSKILIGVDNYILPTDTLVLENHLLIDIQLDYDLAIEENDVPSITQALHHKALVYLKLKEYELASNYAWRLFNLSEKYDMEESKMVSYALLVRLNQAKGNHLRESFFQKKYDLALRDLGVTNNQTTIELGILPEDIANTKEPFHLKDNADIKSDKQIAPQSNYEAGFHWTNQYSLVIFFIGLALFTVSYVRSNRNAESQLVITNVINQPVEMNELNSGKEQKAKILEFRSKKPSSSQKENIQEKVSGINKIKSMTEVGGNSAFKLDEERKNVSNELTADLIKSKRGSDYYQRAQIKQTPLWVSGIEHHLKGMNAFNGIRFDFNYSGDFNDVSENSQSIITNFMTSLTETLVDASNIQSVSSQLVNSSEGLVAMLVARPLVTSRPVLDVITISSIRKVFSGSSKYRVSTHNVPGGLLKIVLKHSVKEYNLVS